MGATRARRGPIWLWTFGIGVATIVASFALVHFALDRRVKLTGHPLNWFEWCGLIGAALALAGLLVAIDQAVRARSAAEQASAAVDAALGQLARTDLMVDLSTLRQVEFEVDSAVETKDRGGIRRLLREVRDTGAKVVAILKQSDEADPLIETIETIREAAWKVKIKLVGAPKSLNLETATEEFRAQLAPACNAIATRMSELRLEVRGEESDGTH